MDKKIKVTETKVGADGTGYFRSGVPGPITFIVTGILFIIAGKKTKKKA